MESGAFKRGWGGHGIPLSEIDNDPTPPYDWKSGPPPDQKQFAPALHCVHIATDGLVYICERGDDEFRYSPSRASSLAVSSCIPRRRPAVQSVVSRQHDIWYVRNHLQSHFFSNDAQPGPPHSGPRDGVEGCTKKLLTKLALLGEYLNSVVATLADIDEPIGRDVDAVERGRELLLIGGGPDFQS